MEITKTKIFAYVGFAKKSKKLLIGSTALKTAKKSVYLLLVCSTATENAKKEAEGYAKKFSCPVVMCDGAPLSELVLKENCKVAAVCDKNLAQAILTNISDGFYVLSGDLKG